MIWGRGGVQNLSFIKGLRGKRKKGERYREKGKNMLVFGLHMNETKQTPKRIGKGIMTLA